MNKREVVVLSGVRTAIGTYGGTLKDQPPDRRDGELNYIITRILKETYPQRYHTINRAIGVLEACKLEYYRRVAAPYEDTKIQQNGDV
ncbi:MAG: hypothetical protein QF922_04125 [SAR324 cluster bacterium]|nr:hypothetical protein [SAR324 cluster bacterium]